MSIRWENSFCRICPALCAVEVGVMDGKIVQIRPDQNDPVSRGFMCFKGLQAPEQYHGSGRLRTSLRRADNGSFEAVGSEAALAGIAERLNAIISESGPESVAVFLGTQCLFNALNRPFIYSFADAIATSRIFTTMTIDQSAKWIAEERLGVYDAGFQAFESADVWMLIGSNPLVSMLGGPGASGFPVNNPIKSLKEAKARGLKLIVIDPRRTETARQADLFLQPRPGEDATLIAGLLHSVLMNGWHDEVFCRKHVAGLRTLREALASFTPARVAERAGVPVEQLLSAARMFAADARTGMAGTGTGPDMGPRSNLAQHLTQALNAVCGRYLKPGDQVSNPGVLAPPRVRHADVNAAARSWETGPKTKVHGLGMIRGQMMSAVMADEILYEGKERIRALICDGGNPVVGLPDQYKAVKALSSLDLLVTIDPRMSATAKLAHYVIAPTMGYERTDHTGPMEYMMSVPYAHYTPAVVTPEPGSDVIGDWYVFWRLAQHLGKPLMLASGPVPMDRCPTEDELLELLATGSRIPLSEVKKSRGGRVFGGVAEFVQLARPANDAQLQLIPDDVLTELNALSDELLQPERVDDLKFPFRLIVRRDRDVMNSALTDFEGLKARKPFSPAYMNPCDIGELDMQEGDSIEIHSPHAHIAAVVRPDESVRKGTIAMTHCWPGVESRQDREGPATTNRLVDSEWKPESINRMPILTAIPVRIEVGGCQGP